ncbi:MAG: hypothetical protein K6E33_05250 [Lachnospiraceae bacterium]|nr:hypothetical protein [Lachnospiraceae bacterium]
MKEPFSSGASRKGAVGDLIPVALIGGFMLITALRFLSDDYPNTAISACFFLSYRYGFIGRAFIGTVLEVFPYISKTMLLRICYLSEILMSLAVLFWTYTVMKRTSGRERTFAFLAILLFLATPFSPLFTYLWYNCGRMDVFLISIIFIQSALFIKRPKGASVFIILLTALGMLIHTGHTFMYFSVSAALLLTMAVSGQNFGKPDRISSGAEGPEGTESLPSGRSSVISIKAFIPSMINLLVCIVLFSCFHFTSFVNKDYTAETMVSDMQSRTDADLSIITENVDSWYFMDAETYVAFQSDFDPYGSPSVAGTLVITLILLLPVIFVIAYIWIRAFRTEEDPLRKAVYVLCGICWMTVLPEYLLETDMGRYTASAFMTQSLILMSLYFSGDRGVTQGVNDLLSMFKKRPLLWIFLAAETVSLGYMQDVLTLPISERIWSYIH